MLNIFNVLSIGIVQINILCLLSSYLLFGTLYVTYHYLKTSLSFLDEIDIEQFDPRNIKSLASQNHPLAAKFVEVLRELSRSNEQNTARLREVAYSAQQVIGTANSVSENVQRQSDATTSTASAIIEMTHSLQEVSNKIELVHSAACGASSTASLAKKELINLTEKLHNVTIEA
ncbi:methyl-accepting chemotaxis protein [Psychrosphaera algicola]|nr:methyl-accepting chemotaxis protein [Psychrosphaera sp. G1-22]MDC2887763.1 methyl-accepting chemotaxis protein [Psychrosphaera sp. G1-22]